MAQKLKANIPLGSPVEFNTLVTPLKKIIEKIKPVDLTRPPVVIGKSKEEILYESNMPSTQLNFFILPEYLYSVNNNTIELCKNEFETNELIFLVNKNDTATVLLNNKILTKVIPEEIKKVIGRYTFYYYLIKIKLELSLRPSNKVQTISVFKNTILKTSIPFKSIEFRLDDAIPPITNILSFQNKFVNQQLMFEINNFKRSYFNNKIFEIKVNDVVLDVFDVSVNNNIFTCKFDVNSLSLCENCIVSAPIKITKNNSCCIHTIEVIGYNSKGESSTDTLSLE